MNYYKTFFLSCMACTLAYSCANTPKREGETPVTQNSIAQDSKKTVDDSGIIVPSESDTIRINIRDGKGHLKVRKKSRQYVYFVFDSQDFKTMKATLSSDDPEANIRFTQIRIPDGKMDGPFGSTLSCELPVKGSYMLYVHEYEMGGEPWSGDFDIDVSLGK